MSDGRNIAILGGGMAALAAAWRLSEPTRSDEIATVTVYQRGHRLGGKAASHRGPNGRIEEHGLHVWLGYYDNAFRLIRECYDELDRTARDPSCPIQTWTDAFTPAPLIGLEDFHDGQWSTWTAAFPPNDRLPGEPIDRSEPASSPAELLGQSLRLASAFVESLDAAGLDLGSGLMLSAVSELDKASARLERYVPAFGGLQVMAEVVRERLTPLVVDNERARRLWQLLDLISAQVRGLIADDLQANGFRSIDHLEYRDWIASHGAAPETLDGALVRGLYDLAFSHRGGDTSREEFPAGLGLLLATKTFFDYRGALFWKMQAGMGDVVIAPLYQALVRRGVEFRFFHRVDNVIPSEDGTGIEAVELGEQVRLRPGRRSYDPLTRYNGLPCFSDGPDPEQLLVGGDQAGHDLAGSRLESFWSSWPDADRVRLVRGRDFDELVFAIPVGMARHVTGRLAAASPRWRRMLDSLQTVATQAFQLWLEPSEEELGWNRTGSTVTSYVDSYDTWSSMTHLVDAETWPENERPGTVAYFCSSMASEEVADPEDSAAPARAQALARQAAVDYLEHDVAHYWPNAVDDAGRFRWESLVGAGAGAGPEAIDSQYVTANIDPSDRYVQALPGTDGARLRPDQSGFRHLHLAGDWTDSGLNAGCIEAAVLSGLSAANSILGLPRFSGITGGYGD